MRRLLPLFIVATLLLSALPAQAGEKEIRGYGEFKLGMPIEQLDLEDFFGPGEVEIEVVPPRYGDGFPSRDEFLAPVYFYSKKIDFRYDLGTVMAGLILYVSAGEIVKVELRFIDLENEFDNLDAVGRFVSSLRGTLLKKYDRGIVRTDVFHFSAIDEPKKSSWWGGLTASDSREHSFSLYWDGYYLNLWYASGKFRSVKLNPLSSQVQEQDDLGKL